MSFKLNLYTPGAGRRPTNLAGRESTIDDAIEAMKYIKNGFTYQSIIDYGLRGVVC